jgi:hypothetical protein
MFSLNIRLLLMWTMAFGLSLWSLFSGVPQCLSIPLSLHI